METVERAKAWPRIDDRKSSVVVGLGMSLTYALLVLLCETCHLTQRSSYFIADLDGAWWIPVVGYAILGVATGVVVGLTVRERVRQSLVLGGLYFMLVSLKVLWL